MYRTGIVLPGWTCPSCRLFNGEEKEIRYFCRGCGHYVEEDRVEEVSDKNLAKAIEDTMKVMGQLSQAERDRVIRALVVLYAIDTTEWEP